MLKEKEVKALIDNLIPSLKKISYSKGKSISDEEYYTGYQLAKKYRDKCIVHSEIGGFPEDLFKANAPNETPEEIAFIKANYKQSTLPVYMDYHTTMLRMFNDNDWYIEFTPDEEQFQEENMQKYFETGIRVFGSLENYFKSSLTHIRDFDANGVLAIKPYEVIKTSPTGEQTTVTDQELYEPQPYYYRCDQVIGKKYDSYYLILLDEKSVVSIADRKDQSGHIFELYDDENIWRITQKGKKEDFRFDYQIYFKHSEGVIPCTELRGLPQLISNCVVWQSKFLYSCDLLDIALVINQYLRAVHGNVCFPHRVILGDDCSAAYTDGNGTVDYCRNGWVYDTKVMGTIKCPSCLGFGTKSRVTRTGQLVIRQQTNLKPGDPPQTIANAMYYVSPGVEPLNFTRDYEAMTINQARSVLHLKTSSTKAQPNANGDTAIGDTLDQKAMVAFIKPEAFQVFTLFQWATDRIGWQRYGEDYKPVYFKYPNNFDTVSDSDYLNRIAQMQTADVPTVLIEAEIDKYIQSLYFNEKDSQDRYKLIAKTDRLFFLSQADINFKLNGKIATVSDWESILHDSSSALIDELVLEHETDKSNVPETTCVYPYICTPMEGFFSNDFKTQRELLINKAKEYAKNIKGEALKTSTTTSVIDNIVGGANNGGGASR